MNAKLDTDRARCVVRVFRDGLLAPVGHDLLIEVKNFRLVIHEDGSVQASCRAVDLEIAGAVKDGVVDAGALSASDKQTIKKDMLKQVLESDRYPEITFRSSSVGERRVSGFFKLHGSEQRVDVSVEVDQRRAFATWTLHQPSFGIKPFKAMFGALKIKPDVIVEVTVPLKD